MIRVLYTIWNRTKKRDSMPFEPLWCGFSRCFRRKTGASSNHTSPYQNLSAHELELRPIYWCPPFLSLVFVRSVRNSTSFSDEFISDIGNLYKDTSFVFTSNSINPLYLALLCFSFPSKLSRFRCSGMMPIQPAH